ncbi:Ran GTPase-activating protein 1 [Pseudocyphellaria aurata]|nr:Ran GTPase-activating protein 1 [Pseudocyphellaria aurata]
MANPPSDTTIFTLSTASLKLDTADDIRPHLKTLVESATVSEIRLGGNTLGPGACEYLASILSSKRSLHTADLADIFTSRLLSEIPPALSSLLTALLPLENLRTIDLSDNAFGLNTQAPLADFLAKHVPLKHLVLNNNGLGPKAGVLIADALTALADRKNEARKEGRDVPALETVVCGRNRLESGSMAAWAKAFRAHCNVRVVKMVQNGIRQEGISVLLREGLKECSVLQVLDLQDNTMTIVGAKALAEVVGGWHEITELGVGDCLLGANGAVLLAEALGKGANPALRVLRAQYNDIDAKAVTALLTAAKKGLEALRRVELNGNRFSEDGAGVVGLRKLLEERRKRAGGEKDEDDDEDGERGSDEWGLDDLSDLEDEDEDEDEDEGDPAAKEDDSDEEIERDGKAEKVLADADREESSKVGQRKDADVDELATELGKTII